VVRDDDDVCVHVYVCVGGVRGGDPLTNSADMAANLNKSKLTVRQNQ
jgi:hypothetical protein